MMMKFTAFFTLLSGAAALQPLRLPSIAAAKAAVRQGAFALASEDPTCCAEKPFCVCVVRRGAFAE